MSFQRSSGILLHPTSLPGKYGIGTLGREAYDFVDFLISANQKLWQVYPLGPTGYGDSPYQCFSAFAGNPYLISLDKLVDEGLLKAKDIGGDHFSDGNIDFGKIFQHKHAVLKKAFEIFKKSASEITKEKYEIFNANNKIWLDDYALFMSLKDEFGGRPWVEWENEIKLRKPEALKKYTDKLKDSIAYNKFVQYIFFKQWYELKAYANQNYIKIIGDIPIFVAFDSSDAWSNPDIFFFDEDRKPTKVAGVPPDYFSATGQLWGNPLYNWDVIKATGYKWWIDRVKLNCEAVDIVRIDHFRGFAGYWAVPADEKTAINGKWESGPGKDLFAAIEKALGTLPIIAEDLGVITPDVEDLRDSFNFPGMKILQFAFDSEEESDYLPHNYPQNSVVYTGTHDNDTIVGWYAKAKKSDQEYAKEYLNSNGKDVAWDFIRGAWSSAADIAIIPLQDLLGLGSEARINTPGNASGNWQWRFKAGELTKEHAVKLKKLTKIYHR